MQDFQPIPGLAGRIFSGGGGGGSDHRRLRGFPGGGSDPPAPSKCPRCESLNTKFCYYNNYNLSQPRHFCKSCRRYWTKGGVLRNVPVGGGCRKSSSKKPSAAAKKPAAKERRRPPASRSSSDSSSLTNPNANPSPALDLAPIASKSGQIAADPIFPEPGSFTSLITSAAPAPAILGFGFSDLTPFQLYPKGVEEMRTAGMLNQTVPMEAAEMMNGLDWPAVDSGIFDLTSAVDPGAFWNQGHWCDADPSLYLP